MYNRELSISILRKMDQIFPTPTSSDDLWEFQVQGFKNEPKKTWLEAIDALLKLGHIKGTELREGLALVNAGNLTITTSGREELSRATQPTPPSIGSNGRSKLVFLSHAAKDQATAIYLKKVIETAIPGSDVFVSSDTEDLRPGDEWVKRIRENLREARILLLLASERALSRPWVWYETGSAWSREIRMIPCCVGKVRKGGLSAPFSFNQALNADETTDFRNLLGEIGRELGLAVQLPEILPIVVQLQKLDRTAHESDATMLTPDEIQLRVDAANVSAAIRQGYSEWFILSLKNESSEKISVREIRLRGPNGIALADPYFLPESKRALEPNGNLGVEWKVSSDPAGTLIRLTYPEGPPTNKFTITADLAIDVGCEILGRFKLCRTSKRVNVDVPNRRIDEIW
jgi:hypothetical protein